MASGKLRHLAHLLQLQGLPPRSVELAQIWVGQSRRVASRQADPPEIRQPGQVTLMARHHSQLMPGRYLKINGIFHYINSVADRSGKNAMVEMDCTALNGDASTYDSASAGVYAVPAAVLQDSPQTGNIGKVSEIRYRVQIPRIAMQSQWARGDKIIIAGVTYDLQGLTNEGDDGITLQLWAQIT